MKTCIKNIKHIRTLEKVRLDKRELGFNKNYRPQKPYLDTYNYYLYRATSDELNNKIKYEKMQVLKELFGMGLLLIIIMPFILAEIFDLPYIVTSFLIGLSAIIGIILEHFFKDVWMY